MIPTIIILKIWVPAKVLLMELLDLYHVENITPEAIDLGESLLVDDYKTYIIDDGELARRYTDSYPIMWSKNRVKLQKKCFIGCPHLSLSQISKIG